MNDRLRSFEAPCPACLGRLTRCRVWQRWFCCRLQSSFNQRPALLTLYRSKRNTHIERPADWSERHEPKRRKASVQTAIITKISNDCGSRPTTYHVLTPSTGEIRQTRNQLKGLKELLEIPRTREIYNTESTRFYVHEVQGRIRGWKACLEEIHTHTGSRSRKALDEIASGIRLEVYKLSNSRTLPPVKGQVHISMIDKLPAELLTSVGRFLDRQHQSQCCRVSSKWYELFLPLYLETVLVKTFGLIDHKARDLLVERLSKYQRYIKDLTFLGWPLRCYNWERGDLQPNNMTLTLFEELRSLRFESVQLTAIGAFLASPHSKLRYLSIERSCHGRHEDYLDGLIVSAHYQAFIFFLIVPQHMPRLERLALLPESKWETDELKALAQQLTVLPGFQSLELTIAPDSAEKLSKEYSFETLRCLTIRSTAAGFDRVAACLPSLEVLIFERIDDSLEVLDDVRFLEILANEITTLRVLQMSFMMRYGHRPELLYMKEPLAKLIEGNKMLNKLIIREEYPYRCDIDREALFGFISESKLEVLTIGIFSQITVDDVRLLQRDCPRNIKLMVTIEGPPGSREWFHPDCTLEEYTTNPIHSRQQKIRLRLGYAPGEQFKDKHDIGEEY